LAKIIFWIIVTLLGPKKSLKETQGPGSVNWPVTGHLSTQGRLDPRGGLSRLEMRKLQPSKIYKGSKTQENKPSIKQYKSWFLNTPKIHCMLLCCYESSKTICKTSGGAPIAF
jgi:hypothetical protein